MNKLLVLVIASIAAIGTVGVGSLSASALNGAGLGAQAGIQQHTGAGNGTASGWQTSLASRAAALNMTAEQLQKALETKTMSQIAVEQGISESEFEARMTAAAKARWEARGLSDSEIAQRTADQIQRHETNSADHEFGSGLGDHAGYGRNR